MNGYLGRQFLLQLVIDGTPTTLRGQRSTAISGSNEIIDVTNKDNMPWRQQLVGGIKMMSATASGVFKKHSTLVLAQQSGLGAPFLDCKIINGFGESYAFKGKVTKFERSGEHSDAELYSLTIDSAGPVTYTTPFLFPPEITSDLEAEITSGVFFEYQIEATNTPTSFNATGLPTGLSINTSTGVINGTIEDIDDPTDWRGFWDFNNNDGLSSITGGPDLVVLGGYSLPTYTGGKMVLGGINKTGVNAVFGSIFPAGSDYTIFGFVKKCTTATIMSDRMPRIGIIYTEEGTSGYHLATRVTGYVGIFNTGIAPFVTDGPYHIALRWHNDVMDFFLDGVIIYTLTGYSSLGLGDLDVLITQDGNSPDGYAENVGAIGVALSDDMIARLAAGEKPYATGFLFDYPIPIGISATNAAGTGSATLHLTQGEVIPDAITTEDGDTLTTEDGDTIIWE